MTCRRRHPLCIKHSLTPIAVLVGALLSPVVQAASFDIGNGVTVTTAQTLNASETGVIQSGGALNVAGATGVHIAGSNVTISNSGTISATGALAYGVASSGINATIVNSGSISTTADNMNAINLASSANAIINNSGSLLTIGAAAHAIDTLSTNATLTNSGSISTTGLSAMGVFLRGANATFSNSGKVSTVGANAYGIFLQTNPNITVNNSGSVSTTGSTAHSIYVNAADASVTNSGSLSTTGSGAYGIYSTKANTSIINSGSIATTGSLSSGIYASDTGARTTNSGSISTAGNSAYGIFSAATSTNAVITNSGSILTSGIGASGIRSNGANATITNNSSISTTGAAAYGIESQGANANINHSGSISVTGAGAVGIRSTGADGVINLSGGISATGSATEAILGNNNQTLNLLPGAQVIGTIDLGAGTNRVNVALNSGGPSATMSITNAGTITQSGKGLSFVNGNTVTIVDTTNLTADQASLGAASSNIAQAVNQQLNKGAPAPQPIKLASNELTPGMLHQEQGPTTWGHAFGGNAQRDGNGAALGFKDTGYGLIGGYEQTLSTHRVGFFGGVSHADVKTDASSVKTDSDSVFLGVYGQYADGDWLVNGSLAAGYVSYDSERSVLDNLSGYQIAKSDYSSTYLSPSVTVIRIFDMGAGVSLRPSAQLNYTYGWLSSYNEKGTTRSNLSVGSRNASALNSRVQMAVRQELDNHQGEFEIRVGASQSNYGDDKVRVSLQGGGATNYGMTGTSSVSGGYVGIGGRIALKNQLSVVGDVEYTQGSGDNQATLAYLGMEYRF